MDLYNKISAEVCGINFQDENELKFIVKKQVINIYETDNVIILVNPKVEKIHSTTKKDKTGNPVLRFRSGIDVNVIPKNQVDGKKQVNF
ncbi:MAG: hypothetical protein OES15_06905 [Nitrosopumilus sp.]|nr:hypothetical protein [Nitrosopumilus sp.]MDH3853636.1 hypothetical protein [Nitrosopumilus sp.]